MLLLTRRPKPIITKEFVHQGQGRTSGRQTDRQTNAHNAPQQNEAVPDRIIAGVTEFLIRP